MRLNKRVPWEVLLIVVAYFWVFPFSASLNNPNERTRVMQARALVEHGEFSIGKVERRGRRWISVDLYGVTHRYNARRGAAFVNDVALVCNEPTEAPPECAGTIYPAKPPGVALLGVPALWIATKAGWVPEGQKGEVIATWILRYGAVFPLVVLGLWCLWWLLQRADVAVRRRRAILLATAFGSGVLPYGLMMVGHAIAGSALIAGLALLLRGRASESRILSALWIMLAGHIAGWAVLLEYHAVIGVAVLGLWLLLAPGMASIDRMRATGSFVIGGATTAAVFAWIHQSMFGAPWKTGHYYLMSAHNRDSQASGWLGMDGFHAEALWDHLVSPYMGLSPMMSWLVVGAVVSLGLVVSRRSYHPGLAAALGIVVVYLAFVSTLGQWRTMNGWSIGPRYLAPAMLPLAYVAGVGWDVVARKVPFGGTLLSAVAMASMVMVGLTTVAYPSPPNSVTNTFAELALPLLNDGFGVRNVGIALGFGTQSLVPYFLVLSAACAAVMIQGSGESVPGQSLSFTSLVIATLAIALVFGLLRVSASLMLVCIVPVCVSFAGILDRWLADWDTRFPWLYYLLAACILVPSVLPSDGAIGVWSERFAFGIPAFMGAVLAGIVLVGRTMGIVASWGERVALCVGVIASAAFVLAVAKYTPTEPSERASAITFCQKTVEGALPDGSGRFLSDENAE